MRGVNHCVICNVAYAGVKGKPCSACVKIVHDYHAALEAGAATNCIVALQDRWVHVGAGECADKLEEILLTIFRAYPESGYGSPGYVEVKPTLTVPYGHYDGGRSYRAVPAPQAQAVADLLLAIKATVAEASQAGLAEGRNLLAQLNAGELTTETFERRAGIRSQ